MKTKTTILLLLLAGATSTALAGPPPEFWVKRPAPQAAVKAPAPKPALPGGLTCSHMLVPNLGGSKIPYTSVRCTPEMMKKDWRCQQACASASKR